MTLADISSRISFLTKSDTTSYPNADRLININTHYRNVVALIMRSHDDWSYDDTNNTDYPILTANLVANQQDYSLPTTALKMRRVEITYDGTNWRRATAFDIGALDQPTDTSDLSLFTTAKPFYDLQYSSIFLYPIPTASITGGLKIWVERGPKEFTAGDLTTGTVEPGFDSLFHQLLVWGPAYDYAVANNLPNRDVMKARYDELSAMLMAHYSTKDQDIVYFMDQDYQTYK